MIVIPAIDLRDGCCVQLVQGSYDREMVRLPDPVATAASWEETGFSCIHVVDLDAATRVGANTEVVDSILGAAGCDVQVGGGIRTTERVAELISRGATRVVVGTRALEDPGWLEEVALACPGSIVVAVDVMRDRVLTRGWRESVPREAVSVVEELSALPLAGILVTAVHREGGMNGTDLRLMERIVEASGHPVYGSGGIGSLSDLHDIAETGVAATIVGMALYTGAIDPHAIIREFQS